MTEKKTALVTKSTGSWYELLTDDHQVLRGRLRGKLKLKGFKVTNPIAVGDKVTYEEEDFSPDQAFILNVEPRKNYLVRKAISKKDHAHLIAANIDLALLVATFAFPKTSFGFIDRFLVTCETFRIPAAIAFNKLDIWDEVIKEEAGFLTWVYEGLGYKVFQTSATTGQGISDLKDELKGKLTVVSGHSGVGKSTLLNTIKPGLALRTSKVSTFANKGTHTTTFAEMFEVFPNSFIIDTPGIKELGLAEVKPEELGHYFPEIRARMNGCKFHNCTHIHEPGCAIMEALENGEILTSRYESYLSMYGDEDNRR